MASDSPNETSNGHHHWNNITIALVAGFVAWNVLLWIAIELGRHSDHFPTGTAQPFAWVVAIGIIGYLLLQHAVRLGYLLSVLTALLGIVSMGLIAVGPHGPPPGDPAVPVLFVVFGPGGYALFAVILIIATVLAWRGGDGPRETERAEQTAA